MAGLKSYVNLFNIALVKIEVNLSKCVVLKILITILHYFNGRPTGIWKKLNCLFVFWLYIKL